MNMRQQQLLVVGLTALAIGMVVAIYLTTPVPLPEVDQPEVSVQRLAGIPVVPGVQSEPAIAAPTPIPDIWRVNAFVEHDLIGGLVLWRVDPLQQNTAAYKVQLGLIRIDGVLEYGAVYLPYDELGRPVWENMLVLSQLNCPSSDFPSFDPNGCKTVLLGFAGGLEFPSIEGVWNGIYPDHRFNDDGTISECVDADQGYDTNVQCTPVAKPYPRTP